MTISRKTKKAGALVTLALMFLIVITAVLLTGMFKQKIIVKSQSTDNEIDYPSEHLFIDASFLLKTSETNESVNVSCDLFMTNIWEKESGEIKATAYVSEQNTNFAVFKSTVEFGVIDANKTKELNIPVKFSDNSYKVEILLFENEKLTKKVTLSITTYQNFYYSKGGDMVINAGRTIEDCERDGQWSIAQGSSQIVNIH